MLLIHVKIYPFALYCHVRLWECGSLFFGSSWACWWTLRRRFRIHSWCLSSSLGRQMWHHTGHPESIRSEQFGGSDLENKALVFRLKLLKQGEGRSIQGNCDREKELWPWWEIFTKFSLRNMDFKNITHMALSCLLNQRSNHICLLWNL